LRDGMGLCDVELGQSEAYYSAHGESTKSSGSCHSGISLGSCGRVALSSALGSGALTWGLPNLGMR